jgi:hypothetical protein
MNFAVFGILNYRHGVIRKSEEARSTSVNQGHGPGNSDCNFFCPAIVCDWIRGGRREGLKMIVFWIVTDGQIDELQLDVVLRWRSAVSDEICSVQVYDCVGLVWIESSGEL